MIMTNDLDYTDEDYQDDINDLASAELEEFEHWLDEVNKYNEEKEYKR